MKKILLFVLSAFISVNPASATIVFCMRTYIVGLEAPHERALGVLGKGLTSDAGRMSVFLTVALWHGQHSLYLQTNYAEKGYPYPTKFGSTEEKSIRNLLYVARNWKKPVPFDLSGVTYYVEPAFVNDPRWGRHMGELSGTVKLLDAQDRVVKSYFQR